MMKSRKEQLKSKLSEQWPYISINMNDTNINSSLINLKYAVEAAIKQHVQDMFNIMLDDIYTVEEFEEDLTLR
jgi:hypothetical protein